MTVNEMQIAREIWETTLRDFRFNTDFIPISRWRWDDLDCPSNPTQQLEDAFTHALWRCFNRYDIDTRVILRSEDSTGNPYYWVSVYWSTNDHYNFGSKVNPISRRPIEPYTPIDIPPYCDECGKNLRFPNDNCISCSTNKNTINLLCRLMVACISLYWLYGVDDTTKRFLMLETNGPKHMAEEVDDSSVRFGLMELQ